MDRQTVLNDDDGSLTGRIDSVSVNKDFFFNAPVQESECKSEDTADTSPYPYVTLAAYKQGGPTSEWSASCENRDCYGLPLYRQLVTQAEKNAGTLPSIRMMGAGTGQRSNLVTSQGTFYVDTTVGKSTQQASAGNINVFEKSGVYNFFLIYANSQTNLTLQMYVGKDTNWSVDSNVSFLQAGQSFPDGSFALTYTFKTGAWPTGWTRKYDAATGILIVTMDLSGFSSDYAAALQNRCGPRQFISG